MSDWPLIIIALIAILILGIVLVLIAWKKIKEEGYKEPDYRAFFIMGICLLPIGIIFMTTLNPGFIGFTCMGLWYMAIGLANREKWKKKENLK